MFASFLLAYFNRLWELSFGLYFEAIAWIDQKVSFKSSLDDAFENAKRSTHELLGSCENNPTLCYSEDQNIQSSEQKEAIIFLLPSSFPSPCLEGLKPLNMEC